MILRTVVILIVVLLISSCGENKVKPKINTEIRVEEMPSQESWNSKIVFSDSGKIKAVLETGHLRVYEESKETLLDDGVKVDFYSDEEVKTTTLTSVKGRVEDNTQNLFAIDSVVAVNDSGVTITTDELMWRNKDKKIVSDKFVTITTPVEKIQGYGFESDQGLQNYIIWNITYITRTDTSKNSTSTGVK